MSDNYRERRSKALPNASGLIAEAIVPEVWLSRHLDDFIQLFLEAYEAYLASCPRASIIVAGEALLRAVFARIESEVVQRRTPLTVQTRGNRPKTLVVGTNELAELPDGLTFCEALDLLKQNRLLPDADLDIAYTVKDLRNRAVHGKLPLLDEWDPDSPRPLAEKKRLMESELNNQPVVFPEGYRFIPSKKGGTWFTFDCRRHNCCSLKGLAAEEQYAAIQYCLVVDALFRMFQETIRTGDRVRQKGTGKAGIVVETNAFSRVYRVVKWDDGKADERVLILDIEKIP